MSKTELTRKNVIQHAVAAILFTCVLTYFVFNIIFPMITNHGESLTVPNLEGVLLEDLDEYLEERDLRYEVEKDSGFSAKYPALAVLKQFPLPHAKVKENRKIYIILNAKKPPMIRVPHLNGRSLKNAQLELRSLGLELGDIKYEPDFALNTVLKQYYKGRIIHEGDSVAKGSSIDFEVGDGLGNQAFQMLDLKELDVEEATFVIRGYGLKLGDVIYEENGDTNFDEIYSNISSYRRNKVATPGKVFKQNPASGSTTSIGQNVDLWVVKIDSVQVNTIPTLEIVEEE